MRYTAKYWIDKLELQHHVEGGSFNEVYRAPLIFHPKGFDGPRNACTSIYFLLEQGQFSAFHKIRSDEVWHFYAGDSLVVFEINLNGELVTHRLGPDPAKQESFQCVIEAGSWFASRVADNGEYALVGCTVSPGFDFQDFELAERESLSHLYPTHRDLIHSLTR